MERRILSVSRKRNFCTETLQSYGDRSTWMGRMTALEHPCDRLNFAAFALYLCAEAP